MKFEINGHVINLKDYYCEQKGYTKCAVERPYVNMYVQFKGCNATCKFCKFMDCANVFNRKKYQEVIEYLAKTIEIRKISFTGGEPTLNFENFSHAAVVAKYALPNAFKVVNTNGYRLTSLLTSGIVNEFNSIAISRHHYRDDINNEILGFKAPSYKFIGDIQNSLDDKYKLHLSCNLIKGYIDSDDEIKTYLEYAAGYGIKDTGFVSLMKINEFANDNFVFFNDIIKNDENLHVTKEWTYGDTCKCNNYMYIPKNNKFDIVQTYSRCVLKPMCTSNTLVFDGENLKEGFNGKIIM